MIFIFSILFLLILAIFLRVISKLNSKPRTIFSAIFCVIIFIVGLSINLNIEKFKAVKDFKGRLNTNIGVPYNAIVNHLNILVTNNEDELLKRKLNMLKESSRDINYVWLHENGDLFKDKIQEIINFKIEINGKR